MENYFPKLDIPIDFLAEKNIDIQILNLYGRFPCKIKSAIFLLCTGGELEATINFSDFRVGKGDFAFLIPESFIQLHKISDDFKFYFVAFSSTFLEKVNMTRTASEFVPVISLNPILRLSEDVYDTYIKFYEYLISNFYCNELIKNDEVYKSILNLLLQQVWDLYLIENQKYREKMSRDQEIYMQFIFLLHQNFTTEHRISFYAERIGITVQHFCRIIKRTSGKKASEIIDKYLIMEAKTRLKFTEIPVKNIAFELGFTNNTFFYKWFKNRTGLTPMHYREN